MYYLHIIIYSSLHIYNDLLNNIIKVGYIGTYFDGRVELDISVIVVNIVRKTVIKGGKCYRYVF